MSTARLLAGGETKAMAKFHRHYAVEVYVGYLRAAQDAQLELEE